MRVHSLMSFTAALTTAFVLGGAPLVGQEPRPKNETTAGERAESAAENVGEAIGDAWLVTKVKAQYYGEDDLDGSDINVDARDGVIILKGTVASAAGKARAIEIARKTEGVKRVEDQLTIGVARRNRDRDRAAATAGAAEAVRESREETREEARETERAADKAAEKTRRAGNRVDEEADAATREAREESRDAKRAGREAARDTREAVGTAGEAISDSWITGKVKASFVGVDALEGSDIDVDTKNGVVTLRGTVASQAGKARAVDVAKKIDGVKRVVNELTVGAKR